jgi:hypothetical protein
MHNQRALELGYLVLLIINLPFLSAISHQPSSFSEGSALSNFSLSKNNSEAAAELHPLQPCYQLHCCELTDDCIIQICLNKTLLNKNNTSLLLKAVCTTFDALAAEMNAMRLEAIRWLSTLQKKEDCAKKDQTAMSALGKVVCFFYPLIAA